MSHPTPATPCNPLQPPPPATAPAKPQPPVTSCNPTQPISRRRRTNPPRPLRPVQLRALALLVRGYRLTLVARHLGVTRQTLWRWHNLPQFQAQAHQFAAQ